MRFVAGFLTALFFRPLVRLLGVLIVLALISGAVLNAGQGTAEGLRGDQATIVRAVDGDTIIARLDGHQERVRVLGIDTPETVKRGTAVQRCGPDASARAKTWAKAHQTVTLARDPAAPNRDRYSRLLRYVQPEGGGRDLSTVQVAAGLARVKAYGEDLKQLPGLQVAQRRAKAAHRGIWGTGCAA